NFFVFNDALWFDGGAPSGFELYKLGADGSVTQWTAGGSLNPRLVSEAAADPDSTPSSIFENAAWLQGNDPVAGNQLFKLGADGSVTLWSAPNHSTFPNDWARFA